HRQQDDSDTPVTDQAIEPFKNVEQRQGDEEQPAEINGAIQVRSQSFQPINDLGTDISSGAHFCGLTRCYRRRRINKAHNMEIASSGGLQPGFLVPPGAPYGHEVTLHEGLPAISDRLIDALL